MKSIFVIFTQYFHSITKNYFLLYMFLKLLNLINSSFSSFYSYHFMAYYEIKIYCNLKLIKKN